MTRSRGSVTCSFRCGSQSDPEGAEIRLPVPGPRVDTAAVYSDDEIAALYDVMNPWDPRDRGDAGFYNELVMAADSVLDVGCGTGSMLHKAREQGHVGRLAGLDPDRASLARARRRADVEWVQASASDAPWRGEFELATMTGHAFQCLITDEDVLASLAGVHRTLRAGGRFAFETRHPQARAWEAWNPANPSDVTDQSGRALRVWHEVESVTGEIVALTETTAGADGQVLHVGHGRLRFLDVPKLDEFLAESGFAVTARYGGWDRAPMDSASREIITIARKP